MRPYSKGRLIALVLNLGNALNNSRGPAAGFALSSLPKLLDTRSFDGKTTLLHYLAGSVARVLEPAVSALEST